MLQRKWKFSVKGFLAEDVKTFKEVKSLFCHIGTPLVFILAVLSFILLAIDAILAVCSILVLVVDAFAGGFSHDVFPMTVRFLIFSALIFVLRRINRACMPKFWVVVNKI